MAGEGEIVIRSPCPPAGFAEQNLDQIPVQAAIVFAEAIDERLDVELYVPVAGHAIDRKARPDLQLLAECILDKENFMVIAQPQSSPKPLCVPDDLAADLHRLVDHELLRQVLRVDLDQGDLDVRPATATTEL